MWGQFQKLAIPHTFTAFVVIRASKGSIDQHGDGKSDFGEAFHCCKTRNVVKMGIQK